LKKFFENIKVHSSRSYEKNILKIVNIKSNDGYVFLISDILALCISLIFSFWFRFGKIDTYWFRECLWLFPTTLIVCLNTYLFSGQYKGITKYLGSKIFYSIILRNFFSILIISYLGLLFQFKIPPRTILFFFFIILCCTQSLIRVFIRDLIRYKPNLNNKIPRVVIYGAGSSGAQLESSLRISKNYIVKLFIDENPSLWGQTLNGLPVKKPSELKNFVHEIDVVLLANPSENRTKVKKILSEIQRLGVPALQIPSIKDITCGKAVISDLKPIVIEDLLGREKVEPDINLINNEIKDSIICVTGAGGSIGSELAEQILNFKPKKLILVEWNETNLYIITEKLRQKKISEGIVEPVLGNIQNYLFIECLIRKFNIEYIFHSAAYKHVPIIERNPLQGLLNNVLSTDLLCKAANKMKIKKFILISSDKAVRPKNIMGATKRLSEMIVQSYTQNSNTCFSMVRFGNVLNSSGSVVPLFKKQIARGGPITITHPEMIRYFMTIEEASELVLHSASLAKGGEVFLLDMGEPIKIKDLAYQMVNLSGLSIKDLDNPNGDIEIEYVGIRPGEKLYEELLIEPNSKETKHPLIFKANEKNIDSSVLKEKLEILKKSIYEFDEIESIKILKSLITDLP